MRITDVISRTKKPKEMKSSEQHSPMEQADWEDADELINDENGFVNPEDIPPVDKHIRKVMKKSNKPSTK